MRPSLIAAVLMIGAGSVATTVAVTAKTTPSMRTALAAAVAAPTRTATNVARDKYRKPAETLAFFGVKPTDNVVEIWPGGGWYTEILAPYLRDNGQLTVVSPPGSGSDSIAKKLDANAATYGKVARANFPSVLGGTGVAPGSADVVMTFRNVHNWRMGAYNKDVDYSEAAFREIYAMLKPGGVLGIEDHRLPENMDTARERSSGYMKVSTIRMLAQSAGFQFAGSSEVNANSRDTHDYPKGVWTLPPRFAEGDTDRAKYAAIGESDRMTLKFVKPRR
ncbi:class I SAM-dependent methyltransferase [Sphingomonas sp. SUN039]|uniref:class I SAM-dependent methyltransferase n=1 Tax=Sphingomonas sp. SUN039 TaxID=2937787 RepID=UPI0021645AD2|nr:methyltransferase [Sphingomonas sp. SUN039]UVO54068.1 methyltransferase [Sphingomonas sp. SUN039]